MEQLGNLLTAMIAVIVSGNAGVLLDPPIYSIHPQLSGINLREFRHGGRYFGVYARVARKCDASAVSVRNAVTGKGNSLRLLNAFLSEIKRVDSSPTPDHPQALSAAERKLFLPGGKYCGLLLRTAKSQGMSTGNLRRVAAGKQRNDKVLLALRRAMAHVDAEPSAKKGGTR